MNAESIVNLVQRMDESALKSIIKQTSQDQDLRVSLSEDTRIWSAVGQALNTENPSKTIFALITNLSAAEGAGDRANDAGIIDRLIKLIQQSEPIEPETVPSIWQCASNLQQTLSHSLFEANIGPYFALALDSCPVPALRLLEADTRRFSSMKNLLDQHIFEAIVKFYSQWYEQEAMPASIVNRIFKNLLLAGHMPQLLDAFANDTNPIRLAESVMIFKITDAALTVRQDIKYIYLTQLAQTLEKYTIQSIAKILPFITSPRDDYAILWWKRLLINLESLTILAADIRHELDVTPLLKDLIGLLIAAKSLPAVNKLGDGNHEINPKDFPMIKSVTIPLISVLVAQDKEGQDLTRETGGLAAVLEATMIDANNPFAREKAIVCIRYLLDGNKENQDFVAQLEAKKVVNAEALEKAGYETEIVNGQFKLKSKADQQSAKIEEIKD